jgi:hypothetical protein
VGEAPVDGLGEALDDPVAIEEEGRAGSEDGGGLVVEGVVGDTEGERPVVFEVPGSIAGREEERVGVPGAGEDDHPGGRVQGQVAQRGDVAYPEAMAELVEPLEDAPGPRGS